MPVQYVPGPLCLPCSPPSPRLPCVQPQTMEANISHRGSTPSLQPSLNWGLTCPRVPLPRTLTPPQTVSRVAQTEVSVLSWRTPAPMTFKRHLDTSNSNTPASASNRKRKRKRSSERELTTQKTRSRSRRSWSYTPTWEKDGSTPKVGHSPSLITMVLLPRLTTANFTLTIPDIPSSAPPLVGDTPSTPPSSSLPWYNFRRTPLQQHKLVSSLEENPSLRQSPTPPPT